MQKDEALARAIKALSRELQELVEDGVRLGWTVTFNPSSGIMTLRSPGIHGQPQVLPIPRGARSLNENVSRQWHLKLRRYGNPDRLTAEDRETLSPHKEEAKPRSVQDVELPEEPIARVHEAAERARKVQEAIDKMGAGSLPPREYVCGDCGATFSDVHRLGGHVRAEHGKLENPTPKKNRPRSFNGRKSRARPCLICGELKKNMGPHYKWHRARGEILVIKRNGEDVEVTTTPEQQGVDEMTKPRVVRRPASETTGSPQVQVDVPREPKHMNLYEAMELIYDAASDALGKVDKGLAEQVAASSARIEELVAENNGLRERLARIQSMLGE